MGKKGRLSAPTDIRCSLFFQQIDERQRAFVIAVQHGKALPCRRLLGKPGVLTPPPGQPAAHHRCTHKIGRCHPLGMAVGILPDKIPRGSNNAAGGAVIGLQIEHLCLRPVLLEGHQRLRISGAKTVNALILVAHHKQVAAVRCQQPNDLMLDFRGILRLIHMKITIFLLPCLQKLRLGSQDLQAVDHLIIVIHQPVIQKQLTVGIKQLEKLLTVLQLLDLFVGKHRVFTVSNAGFALLQIAVGGKAPIGPFPRFPHQPRAVRFVTDKLKSLSTGHLFKLPDDPGAHPVDGAKFQSRSVFFPKSFGKSAAQIGCRRHRIGHRQNRLGRHLTAIEQIPDPRQQRGGFTAAGDSQQQHRPFGLADGSLLLLVQPQGKLLSKGFKDHHL